MCTWYLWKKSQLSRSLQRETYDHQILLYECMFSNVHYYTCQCFQHRVLYFQSKKFSFHFGSLFVKSVNVMRSTYSLSLSLCLGGLFTQTVKPQITTIEKKTMDKLKMSRLKNVNWRLTESQAIRCPNGHVLSVLQSSHFQHLLF